MVNCPEVSRAVSGERVRCLAPLAMAGRVRRVAHAGTVVMSLGWAGIGCANVVDDAPRLRKLPTREAQQALIQASLLRRRRNASFVSSSHRSPRRAYGAPPCRMPI